MRNAGLDEAQVEIKISGRNINKLRYADDATLMAESEEELKSLLMKVKVSFNFMAAVTICSNFGAPQNKVCHCFHCFTIYLP